MFDIKEFLKLYNPSDLCDLDFNECEKIVKELYRKIVENDALSSFKKEAFDLVIEYRNYRNCGSCFSFYSKYKTTEQTTKNICGYFANNISSNTNCKNMLKAIKYFIDNYDDSNKLLEIE
jgi:hypothetical protein